MTDETVGPRWELRFVCFWNNKEWPVMRLRNRWGAIETPCEFGEPCYKFRGQFVRYGVIATRIAEASIDGRRLRSRERL